MYPPILLHRYTISRQGFQTIQDPKACKPFWKRQTKKKPLKTTYRNPTKCQSRTLHVFINGVKNKHSYEYNVWIEYYSAIKKMEIMSFATIWIDLEDIMPKWNKSDRKRQILCNITYLRDWKRNKIREHSSGFQCAGGRGSNVAVGRYKLLGLRQGQECVIQHGESSQCFITMANWK